MYSQNNEEQHIVDYFDKTMGKNFTGILLSIGENDGITLSNSRRLIELGWRGILVEPSVKAFKTLFSRNGGNENSKVWCFNVAISDRVGEIEFYESGPHLGKDDVALLSTVNANELERWKGSRNKFTKTTCLAWDFATLQEEVKKLGRCNVYDFITIDAEGVDLVILEQIDLTHCQLLCIEWNGLEYMKTEMLKYTSKFGMTKIIYQSGENLLIARPS